jgi:hypothetical protein
VNSAQSAKYVSLLAVINFLIKRLTPELFMPLEAPEQNRLKKTLLLYSSPDKSCECAGQAVENYLRMLGVTTMLDLTAYEV